MHECPMCSRACDCDGEDHFQPPPRRCECAMSCEDEEDEEGYYDDETGDIVPYRNEKERIKQ